MRNVRLIFLAAVAAALLAPAGAHAALGWHDAGAGAPAGVTFSDVAVLGAEVIAVGSETTGTEGQTAIAIYRLTGGAWLRDPVLDSDGAPRAGQLNAVAANASKAWAVGVAEGKPLVLELAAPSATSRTWTAVPDLPTDMGAPLAVSLSATGGLIGDDAGKVWRVSGADVADEPVTTTTEAPVTGVSAGAGGAGTAVTEAPAMTPRIFNVDPLSPLAIPALAVPQADVPPLRAVATRGTVALAADETGYWELRNQAWQRASAPGDGAIQLADVSLGSGVQALAGSVGADGHVWRRSGSTDTWTRETVATGAAINGVEAVGTEDVWAVGENGVVMRYWHKPDPPPQPCGCEGGGSGGGSAPPSGGGAPAPSTSHTASSPNQTTTTTPPRRAGDPVIYVIEKAKPKPKRKGRSKKRRARLMYRVAVVRRGKRLIVSFRLRARARVAIAAKRGRAVVSRARTRTLRKGRRRIVLRFKGRPPTALRIVVRPLPAKKARQRSNKGGKARA